MPKSSTSQFTIGTNKRNKKKQKKNPTANKQNKIITFPTVPKLNPVLHKKRA